MPFELQLYSPQKKFIKKVDKMVVPGLEGHFAVLARHEPLIAALRPGRIIVETGEVEEYYNIGFGLIFVRPYKTMLVAEEFYEVSSKSEA